MASGAYAADDGPFVLAGELRGLAVHAPPARVRVSHGLLAWDVPCDAEGRFVVRLPWAVSYAVRVLGEGFVPEAPTWANFIGGARVSVTLSAEAPGPVSGVLAVAGLPADARVRLHSVPEDAGDEAPASPLAVQCGVSAEGRFALPGVSRAHTYVLSASLEGDPARLLGVWRLSSADARDDVQLSSSWTDAPWLTVDLRGDDDTPMSGPVHAWVRRVGPAPVFALDAPPPGVVASGGPLILDASAERIAAVRAGRTDVQVTLFAPGAHPVHLPALDVAGTHRLRATLVRAVAPDGP